MYCQNCGHELQPDKFFCVQCGNQFKSKYPIKTLGLAAVFALICLGIGAFTYFDRKKPANIIEPLAFVGSLPSPSPTVAPTPKPVIKTTPRPEPSVKEVPVLSPISTPSPVSGLLKTDKITIAQYPFNVNPRGYHWIRFFVGINQHNVRLLGNVSVRGGQQDIWVGVLTEAEFENFEAGQPFGLVYGNNMTNFLAINQPLRPGAYRLVFSNKHAQFFSKRVAPNLNIFFTEE